MTRRDPRDKPEKPALGLPFRKVDKETGEYLDEQEGKSLGTKKDPDEHYTPRSVVKNNGPFTEGFFSSWLTRITGHRCLIYCELEALRDLRRVAPEDFKIKGYESMIQALVNHMKRCVKTEREIATMARHYHPNMKFPTTACNYPTVTSKPPFGLANAIEELDAGD